MLRLTNKLKCFFLMVIIVSFCSCSNKVGNEGKSNKSGKSGNAEVNVNGIPDFSECVAPDTLCFEASIVDTPLASIVDTSIINSIVDTSMFEFVKSVACVFEVDQDSVSLLIEDIPFGNYYVFLLMKDSLYHASGGVSGGRKVLGYYKNPMDPSQAGVISLNLLNPSVQNVEIYID